MPTVRGTSFSAELQEKIPKKERMQAEIRADDLREIIKPVFMSHSISTNLGTMRHENHAFYNKYLQFYDFSTMIICQLSKLT